MKLDLTPLENAIAQLKEALDLFDSDLAREYPHVRPHLRAAAIQAFEFTYELAVKMLKRHLERVSANPSGIRALSFSDLIREAYGQGLIGSDVFAWHMFRTLRNVTSHGYDEDKAQQVFEKLPDFLAEARYVLACLQERNVPHE